jgi:hypothetical protein
MKVDCYDSRENCVDTIENVETVKACKDGRHLITSVKKCKCCGQDARYTTQVPSGYTLEIKTE